MERKRISFTGEDDKNHNGVTEEEATIIFREFQAEDISAVYSDLLANPRLDIRFRDDLFEAEDADRLINKLKCIVRLPWEAEFIGRHRSQFERIALATITDGDLYATQFESMLGMPTDVLADLLDLIAKPKDQRKLQEVTSVDLRFPWVLEQAPDLSPLKHDAAGLLAAITESLTLTHQKALKLTYPALTQDQIAQLKSTQPEMYKKVYSDAGSYLVQNSLYGVITDAANQGIGNILRYQPLREDDPSQPQITRLGLCPAAPFVQRYFAGVGLTFEQNRSRILQLLG